MPKKPLITFLLLSLFVSPATARAEWRTVQPDLESDLHWLERPGSIEETALGWFQFTDAWRTIQASSTGRLSSAAVLETLQARGLEEQDARLLIGVLAEAARVPSLPDENQDDRRRASERIFPRLQEAYLAAPTNSDMAGLMKSFISMSAADRPHFEELFLDCFRRLEDPVGAALAYFRSPQIDSLSSRLLETALELHPGHPLLLLALMEEHPVQSEAISKSAALEATYHLARARAQSGGDLLRVIGQRWVLALLGAGLTERAVTTLGQFPAGLRQSLEAGDRGIVVLEWEGTASQFELRDIALDIACAYLLEGRQSSARELLEHYRPSGQPGDPGPEELELEMRRLHLGLARVSAGLTPPSDELELVAGFFDIRYGGHGLESRALEPLPWKLLLAEHLRRSGAEALANDLIWRATRDLASGTSPSSLGGDLSRNHPAPLQLAGLGNLAPLEEGMYVSENQVREKLKELLQRHSRETAIHRVIRLLEAPSTTPFKPILDGNLLPPAALMEPYLERSRQLIAASHLPPGFHPLSADQEGSRLWIVASSPALDAGSDRVSGGYWLLRSEDRGETWMEPLYMGLRVDSPISIGESAMLDIMENNSFRVQAKTRFTNVDCPPGDNATGDCGWTDYPLQLSVTDLELDSDGDGLTDLVEERIACDPTDPDTDGDGLPDGTDPMPQVVGDHRHGVRARALENFLESLMSEGQETLYVVANPSDLAEVQLDKRIVVLSREEAQLLKSKFPATFVAELSVVLFDAGLERCLVVWTSERRGGFSMMRRIGDSWATERVSQWLACG